MSEHVFERDDDVIYAKYISERLSSASRPVIYCEGSFWAYNEDSGAWVQLPRVEVKRESMCLSGMKIFAGKKKIKNDDGTEREEILTKTLNVVNSKLNGVCELVEDILTQQSYFDHAATGLAFTNGFLTVGADGTKVVDNSPNHRCRTAMDFAWRKGGTDTAAGAPRWHDFMKDIFRDDEDRDQKISFLQEFVGTALLGGSTFMEKAAILYGEGSNGKSVFLDVVQSIFPNRNLASIPPQQLSDEYYRARLDGVILNVVSELPKREIVDSPALNGIISGDLITARRPRENPFDFRPKAGHIFAVNPPLPIVGDLARGFWRRWVMVTFNRNFEADPRKREKEAFVADLKAERKGIIRWAIDGAVRVKQQGAYTIPASSAKFLEGWRRSSDPVAMFLHERTVKTEDIKQMFSAEDLYRQYRKWSEQTGHRGVLAVSRFVERIQLLGHRPFSDGAQQVYPITCNGVEPSREWALSGMRSVQSPIQDDLPLDEDGSA